VTTTWTREAVEALGPTTNVPTTAAILGVDADTVYSAIRRNEWTATRVLRLGRRILVPTLDLIRLLYAPEAVSAAPIPVVPAQCHHDGTPQVTVHESQSQCGCRNAQGGALLPLRAAT
jgi:hypothetical protein